MDYDEPPILKRRPRGIARFAGLGAFVIMVPGLLGRIEIMTAVLVTFSVVVILLIVGRLWWAVHRRRRLTWFAREHNHLVCLHCAYPLSDREPLAKCPECGIAQQVGSVRHLWEVADRRYL